jgi:hypothetical protein
VGIHAEATRQIEVADPLACETTVGDEDPAEVERRAIQREVVIAAVPDIAAEPLDGRFGPITTTASPGSRLWLVVAIDTTPSCSTRLNPSPGYWTRRHRSSAVRAWSR